MSGTSAAAGDVHERVLLTGVHLAVAVVARGAEISSLQVAGADGSFTEMLLRTPWAADELSGPTMAASEAEWHRTYPGGWHLLLPRALGPVVVDGVEHPFHGEAAWRTWRLQPRADGCELEVRLRTLPLAVRRRLIVEEFDGGTRLIVRQRVTNVGFRRVRFGWVEHPAFDGAFLSAARVVVDGELLDLVPLGAQAFSDTPSGDGHIEITHSSGAVVSIDFDRSLFSRLYVWQERRATSGFPWHGAVDAIGLEPASQRHDLSRNELGRLELDAGQALETDLVVTARRLDRS